MIFELNLEACVGVFSMKKEKQSQKGYRLLQEELDIEGDCSIRLKGQSSGS